MQVLVERFQNRKGNDKAVAPGKNAPESELDGRCLAAGGDAGGVEGIEPVGARAGDHETAGDNGHEECDPSTLFYLAMLEPFSCYGVDIKDHRSDT